MSMQLEETGINQQVRTGKIISVAYSKELINSVGKEVHSSADVTRFGIPGDYHYGETRWSSSQGKTLPNDRPITILGVESTRNACKKLGIDPIPMGGMGENMLVEGLGDLSDLSNRDIFQVIGSNGEPKVILEVSQQTEPCSSLQIYHKMMVKELMGKRGVICLVLKEGHVEVGDTVTLIKK